ncbi:MAG: adenylyl-sulfate kinase [Acidobacteriaceae bacterium]|nr:adenylyl-sulfate kinase [Acidobacteriaceae bacterium]
MQAESFRTHADSSRGIILWFTGLSASGKTTLSRAVAGALSNSGRTLLLLDGDEVRRTLSADLGFSSTDRQTNMRRLATLASEHALAGTTVLVAAISPFRALREEFRRSSPVRFLEIFVDAPLPLCEARDPKGLYRRARSGELSAFTGIDAPYEVPTQPDVHCRTGIESVEESCSLVLAALHQS